MTGTDLIVLAPWIAFAIGLAAICLLLLRSSRASGSQRSPRPMSGPAGAMSRPGRALAARDTAVRDTAVRDTAARDTAARDTAARTSANCAPVNCALADRDTASGLHPQEAICSQKNAKA